MERGAIKCPPEGREGSMPVSVQSRREEYKSAAAWCVGERCLSGVTPQCSAFLFDWEMYVMAV